MCCHWTCLWFSVHCVYLIHTKSPEYFKPFPLWISRYSCDLLASRISYLSSDSSILIILVFTLCFGTLSSWQIFIDTYKAHSLSSHTHQPTGRLILPCHCAHYFHPTAKTLWCFSQRNSFLQLHWALDLTFSFCYDYSFFYFHYTPPILCVSLTYQSRINEQSYVLPL